MTDDAIDALATELTFLLTRSSDVWCEHYEAEMYAPGVPGRGGHDGSPICVRCEKSRTMHALLLASHAVAALRVERQAIRSLPAAP